MTDKQLKKLSRVQLLEILVEQGRRIEKLEQQLDEANRKLEEKEIKINHAGSIAHAALALNKVFETAQLAADQYLENIKMLYFKAEETFGEKEKAEPEKETAEEEVVSAETSETEKDTAEETEESTDENITEDQQTEEEKEE